MKGRALCGEKTKELVKELKAGDIAVISHQDIDRLAGLSLIESGVKAVINTKKSISGKYPNKGPLLLLEAGIKIYDACGEDLLQFINNGDIINLKQGKILKDGKIIGMCEELSINKIIDMMEKARNNMDTLLENFIDNTLEYAAKEKHLILDIDSPELSEYIDGKEVLIVVRGVGYKNDLKMISPYIKDANPVIIAVDGGADACLEMGFIPDVIVGDMDSISDKTLNCGSIIVVHAYQDGTSPALNRIKEMGLDSIVFAAPGTSEDIAMLLAYENGAEMITAVGTHTNMIDFLEKGRPGMGSTLLVRLKIGNKLVDARGLSRVYERCYYSREWYGVFISILISGLILAFASPHIKYLLQLLFLRLTLLF